MQAKCQVPSVWRRVVGVPSAVHAWMTQNNALIACMQVRPRSSGVVRLVSEALEHVEKKLAPALIFFFELLEHPTNGQHGQSQDDPQQSGFQESGFFRTTLPESDHSLCHSGLGLEYRCRMLRLGFLRTGLAWVGFRHRTGLL